VATTYRESESSWARDYLASHAPPLPVRPPPLPSSFFVLEHVALMRGVRSDEIPELLTMRRGPSTATRQIAMYLSRTLTNESLHQIARNFGGIDHTTVIYSCRRIAERMERDGALAEEVQLLQRLIEQSHAAYCEHQLAQRAS